MRSKLTKLFKLKNTLLKSARFRRSLASLLVICLTPCLAFASDTGSVATIISNVLTYLTGSVGTAICTLVIVGAGFLCFIGKVPRTYLVAIVIGIAIIFSASTIMSAITGF